ncbi:YerC/YecD family TrpR-related protein [Ornithinimicrobium tianjinense]|uniref:DNA-binding transcriptional regulator n=1 Tax=Ornithinimicrobium tianjinense TaxID=1195761 RepID=A0A917F5Y4_9MICO|nr:YerC/YecD family TrpR-related protein [Ornithinimicrobium tianjinense]GGF46873.1 DNA-binding transcriptional regulator [Ornithinimicrobium tianjinense]
MKQRQSRGEAAVEARTRLVGVLAALDDPAQVDAFLQDLCTPAEIEALADRWSVVPLLVAGLSYRQIHEVTGVSVTTVGRIARHLESGAGGYRAALARQPVADHQQAR